MEPLEIESYMSRIPSVKMNAETGVIDIRGGCCVSDATRFWMPVIEWVVEYTQKPAQKTTVNLYVPYMMTSSSKYIYLLLNKIEPLHHSGHEVDMVWYYDEDDDDSLETGEDYQSLLKTPLRLVALPATERRTSKDTDSE